MLLSYNLYYVKLNFKRIGPEQIRAYPTHLQKLSLLNCIKTDLKTVRVSITSQSEINFL